MEAKLRKSKITPLISNELINVIVKAILDKEGEDVVIMDLREIEEAVCRYFVITHGSSPLQIKAITQAVQDQVEDQLDETPWHTEGYEHKEWVLLDYVDVVVHVFKEDKRHFYNLEGLWHDAKVKEYQNA
jgi:ribosome-associated protein